MGALGIATAHSVLPSSAGGLIAIQLDMENSQQESIIEQMEE